MIAVTIILLKAGLLTYLARSIDKKKYNNEVSELNTLKPKISNNASVNINFSYIRFLTDYKASIEEILEVEKQIKKKGFWEEHNEWRISTVTSSKIKLKIKDGEKYYETTVKCEQEVIIPAKTIERAIIFKKVYEDFQKELWRELGWASWSKKNKL